MNTVRKQLLNALIEHGEKYVSGEELSQKLNVSRTAIWKHIEELRKEGYQIEAVRKQGYRIMEEPNTLTSSTLIPHLQTNWLAQHMHVYEDVDSTQQLAHQFAQQGAANGTVILAEQQNAGKGRLGRTWFSPKGTGLWMSFVLRPELALPQVPQLTLLSSVAVLRGIKQVVDVDVQIKWPNDLLINHRKLAGILTELNAEADRVNFVILGIGINVNQKREHFPDDLLNVATSLCVETGQVINRKQLFIHIVKQWEELYELYLHKGFSPIRTLWEANSVSMGKVIKARTTNGVLEGIAQGITNEGVLLLQDSDGTIHKIYSADIETKW